MSNLPPFNPFGPGQSRNPYPTFEKYRAADPIHCAKHNADQNNNDWFLFRHADNVAWLRDDRLGNNMPPSEPLPDPSLDPPSKPRELSPYEMMAGNMMLLRDPPDHTRLRTLVSKAFTPRTVANLDERIQSVTNHLLDQAVERGEMDVIADLAFPLPVIIIAEMLGMPAADRELMRKWSVAFSTALDLVREEDAERVFGTASAAVVEYSDYFEQLIDDRRRSPKEDLISGLLAVHDEGDRLDTEELLSMCFLLLAAGHETTVNLIGNGTLALLQNRDQLELLQQRPELATSAVDELLRFDAPVQLVARCAFEDIDVDGTLIHKGDWVNFVLASANRDPAVFADPDRLDIERTPNNYLSFGGGIHYCLGAPLAKLEGKIAFGQLLERLPDLELAVPADQLTWRDGVIFHGVDALPVRF